MEKVDNILVKSNNYIIICGYELRLELKEEIINWYNFKCYDMYYSNIDEEYIITFIDNDEKIVILEKKDEIEELELEVDRLKDEIEELEKETYK